LLTLKVLCADTLVRNQGAVRHRLTNHDYEFTFKLLILASQIKYSTKIYQKREGRSGLETGRRKNLELKSADLPKRTVREQRKSEASKPLYLTRYE
jgi:hypothetical protein